MNLNLVVKLFAWSIVILIVSVLAITFHGLYPLELKYIDLVPTRSFWHPDTLQPDPPVREFTLWSAQDASEQYFRHVQEIVARLKKAGARVIVVPIPPMVVYTPEIQSAVRKIAAYDNVVFGDALKTTPTYQNISEKEFDAPDNWWTEHPMNHLVDMDWGVSSARSNSQSTLFRFVPNQYRESMKGYTVPDVALQAVKKFASIPSNGVISRHFNTVIIGTFRVPVWDDGFAYVKASIGPYLFDPVSAFTGIAGDSLRYEGQWIHGKERPVNDSAWSEFTGKIVVINWPFMTTGGNWKWIGYGRIYAQLIAAILTNQFVDRYNQWDLAIVFLIIILAAALVLSLRTPLAVITMIITQGLFLYISLWLFTSRSILYDPLYPLFALVLCTFVLPVAKVSHERGYYKKQLEIAEENNANLEGTIRRQSEQTRNS